MLKLPNHELQIVDYHLDSEAEMIGFDLEIDPIILELSFKDFYDAHVEDADSFDFFVNNQSFHGRFGSMVYDANGNVRLWMTTAPYESSVYSDIAGLSVYSTDTTYYNLVKTVVSQQETINKLIEILNDKQIIDKEFSDELASYLPSRKNGIDINNEVKNLKDYLSNSQKTMSDIKKRG